MSAATDWEKIEAEYRSGQLSVRELGRKFGISDTAIHKRAKEHGWVRALASKVREAVTEKLVRSDGLQPGLQPQRTGDAEIIDAAADRGFQVVTSHRRDLVQLHGLKRVLAVRLAIILEGGDPQGICLGERESAGDLLEKLSRVTTRLIPLERQAHNLDAGTQEINVTGTINTTRDLTAAPDDEVQREYAEALGVASQVQSVRTPSKN